MCSQISPKHFLFNEQIDSVYMESMYDNDLAYIEEIFQNTQIEIEQSIPIMENAFNSGDIVSLKQTIHKIKPCFGFTGLLHIQNLLQQFEDASSGYDSVEALKLFYNEVRLSIAEGLRIIRHEYIVLKEFNQSIL